MLSTRYRADFYLLGAAYGGLSYVLTHGAVLVLKLSGFSIAQCGLEICRSLPEYTEIAYGWINLFTLICMLTYAAIRFGMTLGTKKNGEERVGREELARALKRLEVGGKPYLFFQDF